MYPCDPSHLSPHQYSDFCCHKYRFYFIFQNYGLFCHTIQIFSPLGQSSRAWCLKLRKCCGDRDCHRTFLKRITKIIPKMTSTIWQSIGTYQNKPKCYSYHCSFLRFFWCRHSQRSPKIWMVNKSTLLYKKRARMFKVAEAKFHWQNLKGCLKTKLSTSSLLNQFLEEETTMRN